MSARKSRETGEVRKASVPFLVSKTYLEDGNADVETRLSSVVLGSAMYETFEHTADLGFLVTAPDLSALFREAGRAFLSLLVEDPQSVRSEVELTIAVEGSELDYLLFDWLHELLICFERDQLLLTDFEVAVSSEGLQAVARGERLDSRRHELAHEVKAITYHQLEVKQTDKGWQACVIVDV